MGRKGKKGGGGKGKEEPESQAKAEESAPSEPPAESHEEFQKPKQRKKKDHGVEMASTSTLASTSSQVQAMTSAEPQPQQKQKKAPGGASAEPQPQPKQKKASNEGGASAEPQPQQKQPKQKKAPNEGGKPKQMETPPVTSKPQSAPQYQDPSGLGPRSQSVPQPGHMAPHNVQQAHAIGRPRPPSAQGARFGPPSQQAPPPVWGPRAASHPGPQRMPSAQQTPYPQQQIPASQQMPYPQQQIPPPQLMSPQRMPPPQSNEPRPQSARMPQAPHAQQGSERKPLDIKQRPQSQPTLPSQPRPQQLGQDLAGRMGSMSLTTLPQRQAPGQEGKRILIETNHFPLSIANYNVKIYHYDVEITPERPYRLHRAVFEEFKRRNHPNHPTAYDNRKNFFTIRLLSGRLSDAFRVRDEEKSCDHPGIDYTITVQLVSDFSWKPLQDYLKNGNSTNPPQIQIQSLDIVLRQAAYACPGLVPVGRSFYSPPEGEPYDLGNGLVLWRGFYQSAILGWKPFLNIDVAHKGFPRPVNCVESLQEICQADPNRELQRYQIQNYNQFIKGLKIVYEIPRQRNTRRTYKVNGLSESAQRKTFDCDGKKMTVEEYFIKTKNIRLRYPHLPCLQVGTKDTCLPIELCTIMEGQTGVRKLDDKQTANMVKAAARPADERKKRIMEKARMVNYNGHDCIRQFGISVASEFAKVGARILNPPSLTYNNPSRPIIPRAGVWRADRFLFPGKSQEWAVLNLDYRCNKLEKLADELVNGASRFGVVLPRCSILDNLETRRNEDIRFKLQKKLLEYKQKQISLVVVILPNDGYGKVKLEAELSVGILTQCIKSRTVERLNTSIIDNILLKINAKLNGTNHAITKDCSAHFKLMSRPVMILGADVTHPAPNQEIPSVAAVTASFDAKAFKYNVEWRIQEARDEIIRDLKQIMINHINHFKKVNNILPMRIVFYRDGVSEGQFKTVLHEEYTAIRAACKAINPKDYEPPITFIVVQKRHHTRFFPTNDRDADGRNKNVPAGTVVDTDITHPTEKDFYLVSHASIQGTARPTKYHVLWDDANMSEDELQVTTYFLCHTFTRCCRSISYPAPTYYAHLAAFRIRNYCDGLSLLDLQSKKSYTEIQNKLKAVHPMFYV